MSLADLAVIHHLSTLIVRLCILHLYRHPYQLDYVANSKIGDLLNKAIICALKY